MGSIGTTLGLFCLIATACGRFGGSAGPIAAPSSGPSPGASAAETAFVPDTDQVAGEARLALTFPDGTRATLRYPAQLRLAEMGMQPDVTITWEGRWVMPPVVFRYGGPDPRLLDEASQPETYSAAEGITASLWRSAAKAPGYENRNVRRWLVFELPTWAVHVPVPDAVTTEHLVSTIHPQETGDGFIVLRTDPPAALSELSGEGGGSQLTLGDLEPVEGIVRPVAPVG
jgi:hypothetical protein